MSIDRIFDLQERLDRQYSLLKQKEFALDTEAQVTKGEVRLLIKQLKQEIVEVEKEYAQRLAQQIRRSGIYLSRSPRRLWGSWWMSWR